jgi:hypothetical protein
LIVEPALDLAEIKSPEVITCDTSSNIVSLAANAKELNKRLAVPAVCVTGTKEILIVAVAEALVLVTTNCLIIVVVV